MEKNTIVLYPCFGMGHVWSMVELARLLLHRRRRSRRHPNPFSITILITNGFMDSPSLLPYLRRISQSHPSISFRHFSPISVQPKSNHPMIAGAVDFLRLNAPNLRQSLLEISSHSSIRALIIDFFCTSALPIAADFRIPVYYYITSGASALAAFMFLPTLDKQISGSFRDLTTTSVSIPGLPLIRATHMPEPVLDRADPAYDDMVYFSLSLTKSDGILVNSFSELETVAVKAIADGLCSPETSTPPIYYVGPVISRENSAFTPEDKVDGQKCISWLNGQPKRSVVFLCFGSRGSFTAAQLKEIAVGLERSNHRFLWVVKQPSDKHENNTAHVGLEELMPEGFFDRTKDRGLAVESWAPQVEVLNQGSVGVFVTHCGWNSILEATVAGVPMVAWPLYAEQHVNKATLVEHAKTAVAVEVGDDGWVSSHELERRISEIMDSESLIGREVWERVEKMKESASLASTTSDALDRFLDIIMS